MSKNHYLHLHQLFLKTKTLHVYSVLAAIFIMNKIEKLHPVISLLWNVFCLVSSVAQSCPTLCNSMNCSSPVATWTATCPEAHGQAPLSMEFSQARILEWVAISFFGDLLNPGIEPMCRALAGKFFTTEPLGKPWVICYVAINTCNLGHGDSGKEDLAGLCG